jgi:hypothetical protein
MGTPTRSVVPGFSANVFRRENCARTNDAKSSSLPSNIKSGRTAF